MPYKPLKLASSTPPHVKALIRSLEINYLQEVHTMLRLPLPAEGLNSSCNTAIVKVLLAVISGASDTLFKKKRGSGNNFKELMKCHYPWDKEPGNQTSPCVGATMLYNLFRNPLTHNLGLSLSNKTKGQKRVVLRLVSNPENHGHHEAYINKLESQVRPDSLSATIRVKDNNLTVLIEALYWGVRQMIQSLTNDNACMVKAEKFLESIQ